MKRLQITVQRFIKRLFKKDKLIKFEPDFFGERYENHVKRYTKSELASLYQRPVNTLMRWIHGDIDLMCELKTNGYNKYQKEFKKEQVRIIFKHLGEPDFHK